MGGTGLRLLTASAVVNNLGSSGAVITSAFAVLQAGGGCPVGTALAGPAADAFGLYGALRGCAALTVLLTAAVLLAPEVRRLTRTDGPAAQPTLKAPSGGSGDGTAVLS